MVVMLRDEIMEIRVLGRSDSKVHSRPRISRKAIDVGSLDGLRFGFQ